MAVQIVDARNPLMYYTEDLMKYASELQVHELEKILSLKV